MKHPKTWDYKIISTNIDIASIRIGNTAMVANSSDEKKGLESYLKMPLVGGAVIGFAAALIQALLFAAGGPQAYGF